MAKSAKPDTLDKLRKKVAYTSGVRKVFAEAELIHELATNGNGRQALDIARSAVERAHKLLSDTEAGGKKVEKYHSAVAHAQRALAYALMTLRQLPPADKAARKAIQLFEELNYGPDIVRSLQLRAIILREMRQFQAALDLFERAMDISSRIAFKDARQSLLAAAGLVSQLRGNSHKALEYLGQALELARAGGKADEIAHALTSLSGVYEQRGEYAAALAAVEEAIHYSRYIDHQRNAMARYTRYARLQSRQGHTGPAMQSYAHALALARTARSKWHEAELLRFLAGIEAESGLSDEAFASYTAALAMYREAQDVNGQVRCLVGLGKLKDSGTESDVQQALYAEAYALLLEHGLNIRANIIAIEHVIEGAAALCDLHFLQNSFHAALESEAGGSVELILRIHLALGTLYEQREEYAAAREQYLKAAELSDACDLHLHHSRCSWRLGRLALRMGEADEAIRICRTVLPFCETGNFPQLQHKVYTVLADACEMVGDSSKALYYCKEMYRLYAQIQSDDSRRRIDLLQFRYNTEQHTRELREATARITELENQTESLRNEVRSRDARIAHLGRLMDKLTKAMNALQREDRAGSRDHIAQLHDILAGAGEAEAWTQFEQEAQEQDTDFTRALVRDFPGLTATERRFCTLLRLNNTTRDMSRLLNVSARTIQSYRYRIRKKLGLMPDEDLNAAILRIGSQTGEK